MTGEVRQMGPRFDSLAVGVRLAAVVESGRLTEGPYVRELEARLSEMSGVHVRAVSSGAAALDIAFELLRLVRFTEEQVAVPTVGHWTDLAAVVRAGYTPSWYHVDEEGQGIGTTADQALWVSIGGNRRHNVLHAGFTVADVSHATGDPRTLAWGDVAVASLYATKVLTAGEGGVVATRHADLVPLIESLRDGGRDTTAERTGREPWLRFGTDRRMPELSAAIGCASLDTLERRVSRRCQILEAYGKAVMPDETFPYLVDTSRGAYKALVACGSPMEAERLRRHLIASGVIPASGVFDLALPDHGPAAPPCEEITVCNSGRSWAERHVALPFHEEMPDEQVAKVVEALRSVP
ncbi:MAG: DegT/DnrJ/EryC1/StrS family aminotransferase [Limnohabitans sp.]